MFKSRFADKIQMFLDQKINSGAIYEESGRVLKAFDKFASEQFPNDECITKEMFESWLRASNHLNINSLNRRIPVIRQLCRFMQFFVPDTYQIPNFITPKNKRYQVHLITKQELKAFFNAADTFTPGRCNEKVASVLKLNIPMVFRMLYACGFRRSEVLRLKREDVNLNTGKVVIRESKGHKARVIFMHPDLIRLCAEYDKRIDYLFPNREYFLCNDKGEMISKYRIGRWFHSIWDRLPESKQQRGNPFTPHSFRHNFALTVLNRWYREGEDLNVMLPYLAEYMGHSNINDLNYYLHLNEEFNPEICKVMQDTNQYILPEVHDDSK